VEIHQARVTIFAAIGTTFTVGMRSGGILPKVAEKGSTTLTLFWLKAKIPASSLVKGELGRDK
jgi:hypothetical protein